VLPEQSQPAKAELATVSRCLADGLSPGTTASRRLCACSRVLATCLLFLFNGFSWDFFRGASWRKIG